MNTVDSVITARNGDTMTYQCKTCGQVKDTGQFYRQRNRRGHMAECRVCSVARNKQWVDDNREKYREINLRATHRYRQRDPRLVMLDEARRRATKRGLEFDLVVEDIVWRTHCPVLGIELAGGGRRATDASPSLDRIDNAKGYIKDNVAIVSWRANKLKGNATPEELRRLADFYGG